MAETPPPIEPDHTALLVMDFQPAVVGNVPGVEPVLARVAEAIALARGHGVQVAYVRVAFADSDYGLIPPTNKAFARIPAGVLHADAPETAVHDAVAPVAGDIVVRKVRVGGMSTTDLDAQLRTLGVDTLILAGIHTSGVVLSTLRDAADRDYRIYVLSDACADPDPEVHEMLVTKVFPAQSFVITTDELSQLLSA